MKALLLFLFAITCFASENLYQAHQAYDQGDYDKALELYKKENSKSVGSYYNLGNIYYRKGELGKAIFYLKAAKELAPRDGDIAYNLDYLRKQTLDKIENKKSGLASFLSLEHFFSRIELIVFIAVGALLFWLLSFVTLSKKSEYLLWSKRAILVIVMITAIGAIKDWSFDQNEGVITGSKINVYSAIGRDNVVLFTLHEGAEFTYGQIVDNNWVQISIADGKKGWIKREHTLLEEDL